MHKLYKTLLVLLVIFANKLEAQVNVTSSGGTSSASYTTLGGACTAINSGTHTGSITIKFSGNTTETGTCTFVASGTGSASYSAISIRPDDTATVVKTITTASAGVPLILLDGADNISFDGRPVGALTNAKLLTFSHTSNTASSHTIRLVNDATFNSFRYLTSLNGAIGTIAASNIQISTGATSTSISNNTFEYCNITGGNLGLEINGSNTFPANNNAIKSNNFIDQKATAIRLAAGVGSLLIDSNDNFHNIATTTGGYQFMNITLIDPLATVTVTRNRVYNLNTAAANFLQGIIFSPAVASGTLVVRNNSISIASATLPNTLSQIIRCLLFGGTAQATVTVEHNTFRIGGTHVTLNGNPTTVGILKSNSSAATIFTCRNNISMNTRTGTANQHVAAFYSTPTTGVNNIDFNTYMGVGTFINAWIGTFYSSITTYRAAALTLEQNSSFGIVDFINTTEPTLNMASLNNTGAKLAGTPLASVTSDYYGTPRSSLRPYRGAYESTLPVDTFDLQTVILYTYGKIPIGTDDTIRAVVRNQGALAVSGAPIYLRSSINGIIGSVNVTIPSAGETTVNLVPYTPFTLGNDTLTVNGNPDQKTTNDTSVWVRQNTLNALSYANTTLAQTGNVGTNPEGEIVAKFYTPVPNFLNQVNVNFTNAFFNGPFPFQIVIYEDSGATSGPKFNPLWVSTVQNTINGVFNLQIPSIPVTGNFFIGVRQTSANNIGFAYQNENPIRNRTFYFRQGTSYLISAWNDFAVNPNNQFRFMIEPRLSINDDLGIIDVRQPGIGCLNTGNQPVRFTVQNLGLLNQNFATDTLKMYGTITRPGGTVFPFGPIIKTSGILNSGDTTSLLAFSSFNFDTVGAYIFKAWTVFTPDGNKANDTLPALVRTISGSNTLPLVQNFNAAAFPNTWQTNRFFVSTGTGTSATNSIRVNINNTSPFAANATITSPKMVNLNSRSVLRFDYKIINNLGGTSTTLINTDSIKVLISADCGNTYTLVSLINGQNHTPSTNYTSVSIPLNGFVGNDITARIVFDWFGTTNDAVVDIDNIRFINDSNDLRITSINNPCKSIIQGVGAFAPQITVNNSGLNSQSSVPVSLQITGPVNYTGTGTITSIASSGNSIVNLTTNFNPNTVGVYTIKAWTSLANDNDRFNDTLQTTFTIVNTNLGDSALNSMQFTGLGNLVANNSSSLDINGSQLSIEAWVKPTAYTSNKETIVHKSNGTSVKYALSLEMFTNNLVFELTTSNGLVSVTSNTAIQPGDWRHVAATYNGSLITLYLNGREIGTGAQTGNIVSNTANLEVGRGIAANSFYNGQIDELKIWNTSRTSLQIRNSLHTRLTNSSSANLVAYYRFDEGGASTTVVDASGNCNVLTLAGTTLPTFVVSKLALGTPAVNSQVIFSNSPVSFTGTGLTLTLNGFSGQDTITVHQFNGLPKDSIPTGVTAVHKRYWIVYKYGSTSYTSLDASFDLGTGNLLSTVTASQLSLFNRANTSNGAWSLVSNPASSVDFFTQNVVFNTTSLNIFNNQWSVGAVNNPLPVKLISFNGTAKNTDALLLWSTASETNNKGFEVERSIDGKNFTRIDFVKGAINSNVTQKYSYTDREVFANSKTVYYRLKQVDMDGKFEYTKTITINSEKTNNTNIVVYPNPINDVLNIEMESFTNTSAKLVITDLAGKKVKETVLNVNEGINKFTLDNLGELYSGAYIINITADGNILFSNKFIKTK